MAAQSLYRKWRSQTFEELVGQEHVVQTLQNALREDRVAHAYLFTGPRGVGKTSMARLLAKGVNCTAPPEQRPCGMCVSCKTITDGRSTDVIEMDAASHTSVDDARELIERVQFRPTQGRYKIYIIDEVHMLSTAAFNALLKTLEEPPEHAIFILATTEVHKVPETILSRCQRFVFTRHTISQMAEHLTRIATAEGLTLQPEAAAAVARAATGSMRDALGALEQLAAFGEGAITLEQVQGLLGMTSAGEVDNLVLALLERDIQRALKSVNSVADQGSDMRRFARDLVDRLRTLLLLATTGDTSLVDVGVDELAQLETWGAVANVGYLVQLIRRLSDLDYQLRVSAYGHLPLELALVESLVMPAPTAAVPVPTTQPKTGQTNKGSSNMGPDVGVSIGSPSSDTRQAEPAPAPAPPVTQVAQNGHTAAMPAPPKPQQTTPEQPPAPKIDEAPVAEVPQGPQAPLNHDDQQQQVQAVSAELSLLERVEEVWVSVIRDVRPFSNKLEAILRDVQPVNVEGGTVVLLAKSHFHHDQVQKPQSRRIIERILSENLNEALAIRCIMQEQERTDDLRNQVSEVRKDPRVQRAINIFNADVVGIIANEERAE